MASFLCRGTSGMLTVLVLASLAGCAAAPRPAAVPSVADSRLAMLADTEEIRTLLVLYGRTLDDRRWADYSQLFARDGEWAGGFGTVRGPAAIEAAMLKAFATLPNEPGKRNFHVLTNFLITVEGDRASAWSRWMFMVVGADNRASPQFAGHYEDELVREDGHWKFHKRVVVAEIPSAAAK